MTYLDPDAIPRFASATDLYWEGRMEGIKQAERRLMDDPAIAVMAVEKFLRLTGAKK